MSLTFVVGTGRCGSTAISQVFRLHPDVLSVSELFVGPAKEMVRTDFPPVDGQEMWRLLTTPVPAWDAALAAGLKPEELIYPLGSGRFDPAVTGLPPVCYSMLPMLSDDPDTLFDQLAAEVSSWPTRSAADQCRALFGFLSRLFGKRAVVERSGTSVSLVPVLREWFPEARFVHMYRDGPSCALSMSRSPVFRLFGLQMLAQRMMAARFPEDTAIPEELSGLITPPFDVDRFMSYPIPLTVFAEIWSAWVCAGLPALAQLPPGTWTSLRYEDLTANPAVELAKLAGFAGVPGDERWLNAATALISEHPPGSKTAELDPAELAAARQVCAPGTQAIAAAEARLMTPR